jgi:hypothetical protein
VYKADEDMYLNLELQRITFNDSISINVGPDSISILQNQQSNKTEMLSVSIDINNRLAFNEGRILGCDNTTIVNLYNRMQTFLENGIDLFLKNGEVKF